MGVRHRQMKEERKQATESYEKRVREGVEILVACPCMYYPFPHIHFHTSRGR